MLTHAATRRQSGEKRQKVRFLHTFQKFFKIRVFHLVTK